MTNNKKKLSIFRSIGFFILPWIWIYIIEKVFEISEGEWGATNVGISHLIWTLFFIYLFYQTIKSSTLFEKILYMLSTLFWGFIAGSFLLF